jgi:hypothetical protein
MSAPAQKESAILPESLSGLIERVTFANQDSGFTVPHCAAIVTEEGFHQTMVDATALRGVLQGQPAIIGLHALHVLRKDDGHQFVQEAVSTILE